MAYDENAASRVRKALGRRKGVSEKKMFGGIAFLLHGNMCCGVLGTDLVLRLGNEEAERARRKPHTRPMDFTGRAMNSMVYVAPAGYRTETQLARWLSSAIEFGLSLPRKTPRERARAGDRRARTRGPGPG